MVGQVIAFPTRTGPDSAGRRGRPSATAELPPMSTEGALLYGLISAMSVGNDRDRARLLLVRYELGRASDASPGNEGLKSALGLLDVIDAVNAGR